MAYLSSMILVVKVVHKITNYINFQTIFFKKFTAQWHKYTKWRLLTRFLYLGWLTKKYHGTDLIKFGAVFPCNFNFILLLFNINFQNNVWCEIQTNCKKLRQICFRRRHIKLIYSFFKVRPFHDNCNFTNLVWKFGPQIQNTNVNNNKLKFSKILKILEENFHKSL